MPSPVHRLKLSRVQILGAVVGLFAVLNVVPGDAQETVPQELPLALVNGDFETEDDDGSPDGWSFVGRPDPSRPTEQQSIALDLENPNGGTRSAALDASAASFAFTNLMQAIDAKEYRGKRVRFRAAVRTAELSRDAAVQLWFRVDNVGGMTAFDNMQDRPIRSEEWETFDIVLDVAPDATRLNVGLFVVGKGKAWIDDASITEVDDSTAVTESLASKVVSSADSAPQQPFYSHWLWLAVFTIVLLVASQLGWPAQTEQVEAAVGDAESGPSAAVVKQSPPPLWSRFALRFAILYWLFYSFPSPFSSVPIPFLRRGFEFYGSLMTWLGDWMGQSILRLDAPRVPFNGSGDTTYAYVGALLGFLLALIGSLVWMAFTLWRESKARDRSTGAVVGAAKDAVHRDLLRSYLRYVLAASMIGYGLAKVGFAMSQFPTPNEARLDRTYGESSPMGLLWTFMGFSRAYTIFAGFGELTGGLLLLWRRTTTLGALVVGAVMINVVMLNFAYDVPVKLYSSHLLLMALLLLLPQVRPLLDVVVLNRPTQPTPVGSTLSGPKLRWVKWGVRLALIVFVALVPIGSHIKREMEHFRSRAAASDAVIAEESGEGDSSADAQNPDAENRRLMTRGFRWINEVPFNR